MNSAPASQHVMKSDELIEELQRHGREYVTVRSGDEVGYIDCVRYANGQIALLVDFPCLKAALGRAQDTITDLGRDIESLKEENTTLEDKIDRLEDELNELKSKAA